MSDDYSAQPHVRERNFTSTEVANHLNVSPETLQRLSRRFAHYLGELSAAQDPHFSNADVAALVTVQKLLAQGYADQEIDSLLTPTNVATAAAHAASNATPAANALSPNSPPSNSHSSNSLSHNATPNSISSNPTSSPPATQPTSLALATDRRKADAEDTAALPKAVGDVLTTLAASQQTVLNVQSTVRDMVGVVVQDNFNLKDENRKLRERMLEMERVLAEYQRREETRKERIEGRLRAVEGTLAALQQQVAQLVQLQRQQRKRRGWFG